MSELTPTTTKMPAVKLGITKNRITQLQKKFPADHQLDCSKKDDMLYAKSVLRELVPLRTGVEKRRKELVSDAVAWQKQVNAQANELKDAIAAIEKPYRDAKEAAEAEAERQAQERARREEERRANIESKVNYLYQLTEGLLGADLETLQARLQQAEQINISVEEYNEYIEPATIALANAKTQLTNAITQAQEAALRQAELDKQQAELEEQQRRLAEQQAEIRKQQQAQEAREQAQREAEQQRAAQKALRDRLPEDLKLREYAVALMSVETPVLKDEGLNTVLTLAIDRLTNIHDYIFAATQDTSTDTPLKAVE